MFATAIGGGLWGISCEPQSAEVSVSERDGYLILGFEDKLSTIRIHNENQEVELKFGDIKKKELDVIAKAFVDAFNDGEFWIDEIDDYIRSLEYELEQARETLREIREGY